MHSIIEYRCNCEFQMPRSVRSIVRFLRRLSKTHNDMNEKKTNVEDIDDSINSVEEEK